MGGGKGKFLAGMEMEENGAERLVLYFKVFGPWRGALALFLLLSLEGG